MTRYAFLVVALAYLSSCNPHRKPNPDCERRTPPWAMEECYRIQEEKKHVES